MSHAIVVQPEAEADLAAAFRWYELQRYSLGSDFIVEVQRVLDRIGEHPSRPSPDHLGMRRDLLKRFPYLIYYAIRGETVYVLAVQHQRRNPSRLARRARRFDLQ